MNFTNASTSADIELAHAVKHLTEENQRLNDENKFLKEKLRVAIRRIRLVRRFVNTLSTSYNSYGEDDLYELGVSSANQRVTNVINTIISTTPDPNLAYRNHSLMQRKFYLWGEAGTREKRRNRRGSKAHS